MKGIQFVTDEQGQKTAVLIDLKRYGELWEDLNDRLIAAERADEPREALAEVRQHLQRQGQLDG